MQTICEACAFDTDRLLVGEWHSFIGTEWRQQDLPALVVDLMAEPVTRSLPPSWHGEYTVDHATKWIAERDDEGPTLLVVERETGDAVGPIVLFESAADPSTHEVDVRLGYLLGESAWGKGLATELIEGFVGWCRTQPAIKSLAGGVERDNPASARVLEKNGFRPTGEARSDSHGERIYELNLHR
jgi:RimJ/RimL family protein N-acetyltransferase